MCLQNFREPEGQLAHWLERLQEHDFVLVHQHGRQHRNADAMSRMPCTQCGHDTHEQEGLQITVITNGDKGGVLLECSLDELRHLQLSDPTVVPVLPCNGSMGEAGSKAVTVVELAGSERWCLVEVE